jgi:TctA family transporter
VEFSPLLPRFILGGGKQQDNLSAMTISGEKYNFYCQVPLAGTYLTITMLSIKR